MTKKDNTKRWWLPLLLVLALCLPSCGMIPVPPDDPSHATSETNAAGGFLTEDFADVSTDHGDLETTETSAPDETQDEPETFPYDNGCAHADEQGDGTCDKCGVSVMTEVVFLAMNDLHGKFCDTDKQPGVDELTTYIKNARKTYDHVILLSSGDMWQGSSESNLTKGLILTDWMSEVGFASMTLGNHEYDWGEAFIKENADAAKFPFLAINVYDRATGERAAYCEASTMVDLGALQVGIIGAMGDCYSSISGEMSGGMYFKTGAELTSLVKAESVRLREAGADLIVYSLHDGYGDSRKNGILTDAQLSGYYDSSLSDGYVDLVFEGHTHQNYVLPDGKGVYHLQNGGENRGIAQVTLKYNVANGTHTLHAATVVESSTYSQCESDPIVDELMDRYKDLVSTGSQVLGQNGHRLSSDDIKTLVAELYYQVGIEAWGDAYDIVLGGGFLSVRSPYNLEAGEVRYADLQALLPFDNALVLCSVRGRDLSSKFVNTTNKNYFNHYGEYGESVKNNIDPNATYYVVVDTYTSSYAPNHLTEVARFDADVFARDLLADFIREGGLS